MQHTVKKKRHLLFPYVNENKLMQCLRGKSENQILFLSPKVGRGREPERKLWRSSIIE